MKEKRCAALLLNFLTKKAPYKGPGADSEEKHEPVSDIDIVLMDSLKALDPKRPIREADIGYHLLDSDQRTAAKFIHFGFLQLLDSLNLLGTNSLPQSLPPAHFRFFLKSVFSRK